MAFEKVIGQQRVKQLFKNGLENGRISHAYLFVGERGIGKEAMALEFAKALFCPQPLPCGLETCNDCSRVGKLSHPDLQFIFPAPAKIKESEQNRIFESIINNPYQREELWANPSISIEQIREIRRKSSYKSFEGKGRVVIIVDCERMTTEAANSLLKILEEPPDKMYLIMTSDNASLLLPTIMSRCQVVKFDPLTVAEIEEALIRYNGVDTKKAGLTARLAEGSYRRAVEMLDSDLQELQEQSLDFFRKSIQDQFAQILYVDEIINKSQRDLKKIKEILKLLTIWFRDALVFRETGGKDEQLLIHYDQIEVLRNFTKSFPGADLHSAVNEIEKMLELMDRNVQINLILIVLLNRLRNFLRR